jgi:hypothetical protein
MEVEAEISLVVPVHNEAGAIERIITEFYKDMGTKIPLGIIISRDGIYDIPS